MLSSTASEERFRNPFWKYRTHTQCLVFLSPCSYCFPFFRIFGSIWPIGEPSLKKPLAPILSGILIETIKLLPSPGKSPSMILMVSPVSTLLLKDNSKSFLPYTFRSFIFLKSLRSTISRRRILQGFSPLKTFHLLTSIWAVVSEKTTGRNPFS